MVPQQGMMFWTDNMCIPLYAQNPKDAMALMDYYYAPDVQAVLEYYNDYVCPVPAAQQVLLNPTGWAATALKAMKPEIGLPTSVTANAPTVFPTDAYLKAARNYFPFKTPEELTAWNNLFVPITQGS
jgi:spermidine/putrescine transport system substrate-binding protein